MSDEQRVELRLMGISYNPLQSGAFAMLLAQVDGPYRIPVVIGASEAQSIAIKIEGITTPRPMTHDLFCSFAQAYGVELLEVFIYKFEDGIFSAEMRWSDGEREICLDARTSDAVALAMRTNAPIYTTYEILHAAGSVFEERDGKLYAEDPDPERSSQNDSRKKSLEDLSPEQLRERLSECIENEDYEQAAIISELLKKYE